MTEHKSSLKIMMQLIVLVKPMLPVMFMAVILGVAGFICAAAVPVLGALGILNLSGANTFFTLKQICFFMIIAAVLRGILHYGEQASNHYIAFKLLAIIRSKVFGALRKLCPAKLDGSDKGNLISIITSDVELLEVFYAHTISPIAIALITSVIFTIFIGCFSPVLCIISALAYIYIGAVLPLINEKNVKGPGLDYRNKSGSLNSLFLESLRGLNEHIQYGTIETVCENITIETNNLAKLQNRLKENEIKTTNITEISIMLLNTIMLLTSFFLYAKDIIPFERALIASVTLMSSYGSVIALSNLSNSLAQTLASGERVLALLEEKPITEDKTNGLNITADNVLCQNVKFKYKRKKVLDGVHLSAEKGMITGISGKSGCGKSTLLKLIMRFWDKDSGKILLSGTEIKCINTYSLRQNESYCTQETYLFDDTIKNNIKLARLDASDEDIIEAAKKSAIHNYIIELPLGYDTPIGELGDRLSGGEKQRIGLARAFLSNAPIMLLDEPTSNIDSLNEGIILKALYEARDKAIILVSHRKSTMNIANKIYEICKGKAINIKEEKL